MSSTPESSTSDQSPLDPLNNPEVDDEVYDAIADKIQSMGQASLCDADLDVTFYREIRGWSKNYFYVKSPNVEYVTFLTGVIGGPASGTLVSAQGNHYLGKPGALRAIDDGSVPRDVLAIYIPETAGKKLNIVGYNQHATLKDIVASNEAEERAKGEIVVARHWTKSTSSDLSAPHDIIVVHCDPIYAVPPKLATGAAKTCAPVTRTAKRSLEEMEVEKPTVEEDIAKIHVPTDNEIAIGAFYDPKLLPDYRGPVFQHVQKILVQQELRDVDNRLVAPWNKYDALRPGTVVLIKATLHCFVYDDGPKRRKVYQINAKSIKVLAESNAPVHVPPPPSFPGDLPETSSSNSSFDNFDNFVVTKKRRPNN